MRDRLLTTGILALALIVIVGLVKPRPVDTLQATVITESVFYVQKTFADDLADLVILGDSRALRGLAPSEMVTDLPGLSILNLAYNSGGLNDEMYDFCESRLDMDSPQRGVVLAMTPLTLLDWKSANGQYRETKGLDPDQVLLQLYMPRLAEFFAPWRPSDVVDQVKTLPRLRTYSLEYHDDGWLASERSPVDTLEALRVYRHQLDGSTVDPGLVEDLETRIRRWSAAGIQVFVVRMPCQPSMDALEDSMLTFDEKDLEQRVQAAGAVWLPVPRSGWKTYDGSHLFESDARRLSRDLARMMADHWAGPELAEAGDDGIQALPGSTKER